MQRASGQKLQEIAMSDKKNEEQEQKPQDNGPTQVPLPDFEDRKDFGWGEESENTDTGE